MTFGDVIKMLECNDSQDLLKWLKDAKSKELLELSDSIFNEYQSRRDEERGID